jgi:hypothetical protein
VKKLIVLVLLASVLAGCNGVIMTPKYSNLLDETAALSNDTAVRAEAGTVGADEMKQALRYQANVWKEFQNARDGKAE